MGSRRCRQQVFLGLVALLMVAIAAAWGPGQLITRAQNGAGAGDTIQLVHGAADLGTVDVYIDGGLALLGLRFRDTADPIAEAPGPHTIALVPTGDALADALSETSVTVPAGSTELAILGGAADLSVTSFPLDLTPLPPTSARLRFVNGATGFGPADLALTGGDLLFPSVDFGAATEFADLAAGGYDLEVRYGGTEAVALAIPGFTMDPELVYTLYLVGDATAGTVQTALSARPARLPDVTGVPADLRRGSCPGAAEAEVVASLNRVNVSPFGDPIGYPDVMPTAASFTSVAVPFADLLGTTHSLVIGAEAAGAAPVIGCGELGGRLALDGSLIVVLRPTTDATAGAAGMAVLAPNILDPGLTDISVFLVLSDAVLPGSAAPEFSPTETTATPAASPMPVAG